MRFVFCVDGNVQTTCTHVANACRGASRQAAGSSGRTLQEPGWVGWWRQNAFPLGSQSLLAQGRGLAELARSHFVCTNSSSRSSSNILDGGLPAKFLEHVPTNNELRACPLVTLTAERPTDWKMLPLVSRRTGHHTKPFARCVSEEAVLSSGNYSTNLSEKDSTWLQRIFGQESLRDEKDMR